MDRKGLNRTAIAAALAIVMAGALVAQAGTPTTPNAVVVEGHSNDREAAGNALDSRILASIDDATAAALIGALETRFAGREVALRMAAIVSGSAPSVSAGKAWLPRKWSGWWWVLRVITTGRSVTRRIAASICSP